MDETLKSIAEKKARLDSLRPLPDEKHSGTESRRITPGKDAAGHDVLVVHSFERLADERGRVRVISGNRHETEYDFSKGERGKFYRPNAELRLPICLNADIQAHLAERAAQKGMPIGEMANALLKQKIQIIESVK
jgi:hypothetical protein